jgi:hypothetical protein
VPFVRTVEVLDPEDPEARPRLCRLTDSDDHHSDSSSDQDQFDRFSSGSSDGDCSGRQSDDDF